MKNEKIEQLVLDINIKTSKIKTDLLDKLIIEKNQELAILEKSNRNRNIITKIIDFIYGKYR